MISPLDVIQSVLWVYLLILAGAVARRTGVLPQEYDEGIMKVCYMIMIPCFILDKILGAEVLRDGWVVVSSIACGYGLIVAGVGVGFVVGKLAGLKKGTGMRTFAPDRLFVAGFDPRADGFFWLAGQGGYGVMTSPAMAKLTRFLVDGSEPGTEFEELKNMTRSFAPDRLL